MSKKEYEITIRESDLERAVGDNVKYGAFQILTAIKQKASGYREAIQPAEKGSTGAKQD